MLGAQVFAHLFGNLPLSRIDITLVTSEDHHEFFLVIIIHHLVDPKVHAIEALFVCQIVAYDCSSSISIVEGHHGAETLGTARVPDVQFDLGTIRQRYSLLKVGSSYRNIVAIGE